MLQRLKAGSVQVSGTRLGACGEAATVARVAEAPRHEIAGFGAQAVPRVLWGFEVCAGVGAVCSTAANGLDAD